MNWVNLVPTSKRANYVSIWLSTAKTKMNLKLEDDIGCDYDWCASTSKSQSDYLCSYIDYNLHVFQIVGWPNNREAIVDEVGKICESWGLFLVINHGMPPELLQRAKECSKLFFAKTSEEKMQYANKFSPDKVNEVPEGYGSKLVLKDDTVWNWRDYFEHHTFPISRRNPLLWPAEPEFYRWSNLSLTKLSLK